MLQPVICVTGPEAAAMFYAPGRFTREGAMPRTVLSRFVIADGELAGA